MATRIENAGEKIDARHAIRSLSADGGKTKTPTITITTGRWREGRGRGRKRSGITYKSERERAGGENALSR